MDKYEQKRLKTTLTQDQISIAKRTVMQQDPGRVSGFDAVRLTGQTYGRIFGEPSRVWERSPFNPKNFQ